jgi:hypothetical protein
VDAALRHILPDVVNLPELAEAARLATAAASGLQPAGRVLGAANAALPVPDQPHLALWQTATTLREYRGDGHVSALLAAGPDGPRRSGRSWPPAARPGKACSRGGSGATPSGPPPRNG